MFSFYHNFVYKVSKSKAKNSNTETILKIVFHISLSYLMLKIIYRIQIQYFGNFLSKPLPVTKITNTFQSGCLIMKGSLSWILIHYGPGYRAKNGSIALSLYQYLCLYLIYSIFMDC